MYSKAILIYGIIVVFLGSALLFIVYYFWKVRNDSECDYNASATLHRNVEKESRKHTRADIRWQVSMQTPDGTIAADAKNISLSGAFICCEKPLPLGEVFRLTMTGPDNDPVMATAKVVWSNVNVPEEKVINRGMGVRFIKMSDRHLRLVRQIFQESD
ncbi:MAG: PilZ domain-containing protein [Deltaproteobacteria bacterium]